MAVFARASILSDFSAFATSQGLQPQALLAQAGLPRDVEAHADSLIPFRKLLALLDLCEAQSGNRLFALQYGLFQSVSVFGPLFYLVRNTKDVRAALIELTRYFHLHSGAAAIALEEQGRHAILSYTVTDPAAFGVRHAVERAVGVGAQLMRTLLGHRWRPEALLFQHAPCVDLAQYRRLTGLLPSFNATCNGWLFDAALLDTPLQAADPALHRLIQGHLDNLEHISAQELPARVQQLIRSFMPDARATLEQVADYLLLSTRKLQRLLADEGTTFQALLTETRQAMACHYLQDSTISIGQMADLLGYGSQAAFSRAFQQWYGQSPRQWRKANRHPE
ncbi:AraC family transcriptional regulator [Pseudomonas sp. UL073]|uniref:AraC family transcriptional regulator n=1 Tax=Zestomonas insulae TaxID=2809017 RepID=A0ABS2IFV8_9GAMM|nr:AraC family transcriptional regulator [Pseudomonas insulae]MBM7061847.1 AraC family transcriptional regulator [Pseudomonas insulae]